MNDAISTHTKIDNLCELLNIITDPWFCSRAQKTRTVSIPWELIQNVIVLIPIMKRFFLYVWVSELAHYFGSFLVYFLQHCIELGHKYDVCTTLGEHSTVQNTLTDHNNSQA